MVPQDVTLRRNTDGGEFRREQDNLTSRLAKLREVEKASQAEQRKIEREIAEGMVDQLFEKAADLLESSTSVIIRNDEYWSKRLREMCKDLLARGARARPKGQSKAAQELAETLVASIEP